MFGTGEDGVDGPMSWLQVDACVEVSPVTVDDDVDVARLFACVKDAELIVLVGFEVEAGKGGDVVLDPEIVFALFVKGVAVHDSIFDGPETGIIEDSVLRRDGAFGSTWRERGLVGAPARPVRESQGIGDADGICEFFGEERDFTKDIITVIRTFFD